MGLSVVGNPLSGTSAVVCIEADSEDPELLIDKASVSMARSKTDLHLSWIQNRIPIFGTVFYQCSEVPCLLPVKDRSDTLLEISDPTLL